MITYRWNPHETYYHTISFWMESSPLNVSNSDLLVSLMNTGHDRPTLESLSVKGPCLVHYTMASDCVYAGTGY